MCCVDDVDVVVVGDFVICDDAGVVVRVVYIDGVAVVGVRVVVVDDDDDVGVIIFVVSVVVSVDGVDVAGVDVADVCAVDCVVDMVAVGVGA